MTTSTKQRYFGAPILSNGKLPIGGRTKNKLLTSIQVPFLNWFGGMRENSRLAPVIARVSRQWLGSYIYSIKVEINNACELHCDMCYIPKGHLELPLGQIERLFRQIKNCGVRIEILGGEPLLRKDVAEIIEKAKQAARSPFVSMYTNGIHASPSLCTALKNAGLDAALVTLISHDEEVHDAFTGCKGSWEKTLEGIRNFKRVGIETYTFTAVHSRNVNDIKEICWFVKEELYAKPLFYQYIPVSKNDPLCIAQEQWYEIKNWILKQTKKHDAFVRDFYMLTGNACSGGNFVLTVKTDGAVQPCPFISNLEIGNISDTNIWAIYKNRFTSNGLKSFKSLPDECQSCSYASVCGGGCRACNDKLFGSYATKDFRCKGPYVNGFSKEKVTENTPCFF